MKQFETLSALDQATKTAVIDLLYRMADDAIIAGHRGSEWTGLAPILEEDIAFSSMAQDDMGHAYMFYKMLHELGEPDPDKTVFTRELRHWKCASLVSLPNERDWAFCLLRKFLYDAAVDVRLAALSEGSLTPLAQLVRKLRREKKYHLMHGRAWVSRLGVGTDESRSRMAKAMAFAYPHALGMFEPTDADETLAQADICHNEAQLKAQWESAISPTLAAAELNIPVNAEPIYGGRHGRHPAELAELLHSMQLVYSIDPNTKW